MPVCLPLSLGARLWGSASTPHPHPAGWQRAGPVQLPVENTQPPLCSPRRPSQVRCAQGIDARAQSTNGGPWAKYVHHLLWQIKFYWDTAMPVPLCVVSGCPCKALLSDVTKELKPTKPHRSPVWPFTVLAGPCPRVPRDYIPSVYQLCD